MQASNKSDAAQVYEGAARASRVGIKDAFKYILRPLTIFSYHYFIEGIKAVQNDGPTKELEKLTNLSYDETIRIMEKCQKDGVRVVASERKLSTEDSEFGKKKSMYQQKRLTKYARRIKSLSNIKSNYPNVAKVLYLDTLIKRYEEKQKNQIELHKNKRYNIYYNKSKNSYIADRIADLIEYRTGISKNLFDTNTQKAIEKIKDEGMVLNSAELNDLSDKFKIHELGSVELESFKTDYCVHEISLSAFISMKDDLEIADIPYGINKIYNDEEKIQTIHIYFENKHLERYSELGFAALGQMHVYGTDNKNLQWSINSQDELVSFTTKVGKEEIETYSKLSGKNYIMKRQEDECVWTIFKADLRELAEKEKKRDVVEEDLERVNIFEELQKNIKDSEPTLENQKEISVNFDDIPTKEVGDD